MALLGTKIASNIDQNSIQKGIENKMQFGLRFGALLDRFLVDFGAKLGPSWHQNLENWGLKTMSKKRTKKVECRATQQK